MADDVVHQYSSIYSLYADAATDSKINLPFYEISEKFELGQMFKIYFGRIGNMLLYLNIAIYLYGDLSIYGAGVPKSLRNVVCLGFELARFMFLVDDITDVPKV
ncbi:hypothetical protein X801_00530 [Opisthorchis viverrini]|uniref:Uncharacterized protein n=1 Tax=Opisthorchis viverrini TaxID=6198 RepID=A0A1S8XA08_OPIVI|nr:hypothetical protein X801_00530 [Opisthorchis viverrini]